MRQREAVELEGSKGPRVRGFERALRYLGPPKSSDLTAQRPMARFPIGQLDWLAADSFKSDSRAVAPRSIPRPSGRRHSRDGGCRAQRRPRSSRRSAVSDGMSVIARHMRSVRRRLARWRTGDRPQPGGWPPRAAPAAPRLGGEDRARHRADRAHAAGAAMRQVVAEECRRRAHDDAVRRLLRNSSGEHSGEQSLVTLRWSAFSSLMRNRGAGHRR